MCEWELGKNRSGDAEIQSCKEKSHNITETSKAEFSLAWAYSHPPLLNGFIPQISKGRKEVKFSLSNRGSKRAEKREIKRTCSSASSV